MKSLFVLVPVAMVIITAISARFLVLVDRPTSLSPLRATLFAILTCALITGGLGSYYVIAGEDAQESLYKILFCPLMPAGKGCSPAVEPPVVAPPAQIAVTTAPAADVQEPNPLEQNLCFQAYVRYLDTSQSDDAKALGFVTRHAIAYNSAMLKQTTAACDMLIERYDANAVNPNNSASGMAGSRQSAAGLRFFKAQLLWAADPAANADEVAKVLEASADSGYTLAAWDAGDLYWRGPAHLQSAKKAVRYLKMAADDGLAAAMIHLGSLYGDGFLDQPADPVKGCDTYWRAAEAGSPMGQYLYAYCFYAGEGRDENLANAISWAAQAAEKGMPDAQFLIGVAYCEAAPPVQDRELCAHWLREAVRNGDTEAREAAARFGVSIS